MKTSFRSKVFKRAYEIMRSTGKSFEVCLSKAWRLYRLIKKMRKSITEFSFEKKNGDLRRAKGVLKELPQKNKKRAENNKTIAYFDIEKQSFRSFKVENLVTVY